MFRLCCWIQIWFLNLIFSPSSCHFEQQSDCLEGYLLCFVLHFACFLFFKLFACRLQHNEFCSNLLFFPMSPVPRNFLQMCSFSPSPQCQAIIIQKVDLKSVPHLRLSQCTIFMKKIVFRDFLWHWSSHKKFLGTSIFSVFFCTKTIWGC
jgi:hypothetical protein